MSTPSTPEILFTYSFMNLDRVQGVKETKAKLPCGANQSPAPIVTVVRLHEAHHGLCGRVYGETRSETVRLSTDVRLTQIHV